MNKVHKLISIMLILLGIISFGYFSALMSFGVKISFSEFWIVLGIFLIILGVIKGKGKQIYNINSKLKIGGKMLKILIIIGLIFFIIIETPILYYGNKTYKKDSEYLIVLGAGVQGRTMSLTLYQRMEKSLEYIKEHPNTKIIVSGGQGPNELISEAEAMKEFLVNHEIDENRIIKEDKSTNTHENLVFSKKKVEEDSDKDIKNLKICVVTSNFHVFRAKMLGKRVGLTLEGIPARIHPLLVPNFYVRECLAVVKSYIFDR
ncbi:YdcF family protein [Haloimpatiens sp. FM7330]|uniref:YdcF family protein n=1 Tax=Haloimpatiens sp. FM7330 TaxID=3298610 RepID=UPI0036451453